MTETENSVVEKRELKAVNPSDYVGIPFKIMGRDREGLDCAGLVALYLGERGYKISADDGKGEYGYDWVKQDPERLREGVEKSGEVVEDVYDLRPDDILYFDIAGEGHVGVYIGYGKFLQITENSKSHIAHMHGKWGQKLKMVVRPDVNGNLKLMPCGKKYISGAISTVVGVTLIVAGTITANPALVQAGILLTISGVAQLASAALTPTAKPLDPIFGGSGEADTSPRYGFDILQNTLSNSLPVPIIYGSVKMAGNVIYQTDPGATQNRIIALCEGEINAISNVKVNDIAYTSLTGVTASTYLGTTSQDVDSRVAGTVFGLRNLAYIAITIQASDQLKGGNPVVTAEVQGMKVETWDGTRWTIGVRTYSRNPAACIRDFLLSKRYGAGIDSSFVDHTSFGEVYDYCEQLVPNGSGGTEARFRLDYVMDGRRRAIDYLSDMLSSFGGFFAISGNVVRLKVDKSEGAAQNFGMDNIVEGTFGMHLSSKDDRANKMTVEYIDPDQEWAKIEVSAEDKIHQDRVGDVQETKIAAYGIGRYSQASRLSRYLLNNVRVNELFCTFSIGPNNMFVEVGDVVNVSHDLTAWNRKPFRLMKVEESEEGLLSLLCREYNSEIFNDEFGGAIQTPDYGSPVNPWASAGEATGLTLTEMGFVNSNAVWEIYVDVSWTGITNTPILDRYEVEMKIGSGNYFFMGATSGTALSAKFAFQVGTTYTFRVRSVTVRGIYSDGATASITITGKLIPPGNVSNFNVEQEGDIIHMSWDPVTDADMAGYEIREGASWGASQFIARVLPDEDQFLLTTFTAGAKTYLIKSVDLSGNYSVGFAQDSITLTEKPSNQVFANFNQFNRIADMVLPSTAQLAWTTDFNSNYYRRAITIKTKERWDDGGTWDQARNSNQGWDRNLESVSMTETSNIWDLGATVNGNFSLDIDHVIGENSTYTQEYRVSNDTVTWNPDYKIYAPGFISGRYVQFRATRKAGGSGDNIRTYDFFGSVALLITEQQGLNQPVAVDGTLFSFDPAFTGLQSIVVTTVGSSKLRPRISSQSVTGFTCILEDLNDASQSGNINWRARGF